MDNYVKAAILENQVEAQILDSVLNEHNIVHFIRTYHDEAYDGIFQVQKGWGVVYTLEKHKQDVLEIVKYLRVDTSDSL